MKKNIKQLIESIFDDDDIMDMFDDNDDILSILKPFNRDETIEKLKKGLYVDDNSFALCMFKENQWLPKDLYELKDVVKTIEKNVKSEKINLNWVDVSNLDSLHSLFMDSKKNWDVSNWDVSNITSLYETFYGCSKFDCDLSNWNVSNVTIMEHTFRICPKFNSNISKWNISKVRSWKGFLYGAKKFKQDLSSWDLRSKNIIDIDDMFYGSGIYELYDLLPKFINENDFKYLMSKYFKLEEPYDTWVSQYGESIIYLREYSGEYKLYNLEICLGETLDDPEFEVMLIIENPEDCEEELEISLDKLTETSKKELYYDLKKFLEENY